MFELYVSNYTFIKFSGQIKFYEIVYFSKKKKKNQVHKIVVSIHENVDFIFYVWLY